MTTISPLSPAPAPAPAPASLAGDMDWEALRKDLLGADLKLALQAMTKIRERIAVVHTTEFPVMLSNMFAAFLSVLTHCTRPNPETSSVEQQLRNSVLEVMSRLPNNDALRPHVPQMLASAMEVLIKDYEDNALVASRIIFDLHKNYRSIPQDQVQPYLDFVQQCYRALPVSLQRNFAVPKESATPASSPSTPSQEEAAKSAAQAATVKEKQVEATPTKPEDKTSAFEDPIAAATPSRTVTSPSAGIPTTPTTRLALRSSASFRVLTEFPLTVMLLFQLYPKYLKTNITTMIKLMMDALSLRAPPLQSTPDEKVDNNHRRMYFSRSRELVAAQVKTLSFLTQFLRGFGEQIKPFEERIATNVVALMKTCPRESVGTRRELLQATRHILATDFRKGFFRHVDALLDERILLGSHPRHTDQTVLRPLAYSALADLVHHSRSLLSMTQLSRVVYIFSRVLHDSSVRLPLTIQITAVRLLLNIVDIIFHNKDPDAQRGRDLLVRILSSLVNKLGTLKDYIPLLQEAESTHQKFDESGQTEQSEVVQLGEPQDRTMTHKDTIDKTLWSWKSGVEVGDTVRDAQTIVRSIVIGLKTVIWCVNNYKHQREKICSREPATPPPGSNDQVASAGQKLTSGERELIDEYITHAVPCIAIFKGGEVSEEGNDCATPRFQSLSSRFETSDSSSFAIYREVLTYFASAFTVLDAFNLQQTIGKRIDLLFDAIVEDRNVMVVPRQLLVSNQNASHAFCVVLLAFLVDRLDTMSSSEEKNVIFFDPQLSSGLLDYPPKSSLAKDLFTRASPAEKKQAATILELFERVLKSFSSFPDNEAALRPHLQRIVTKCLKSTMESTGSWPDRYCTLLRFTFRSISAGKFEQSYKQLLPLITTILNGLYRIFLATEDTSLRHIIVELCLTIPARLSSLLPHMSLLIRMIIPALQSNKGELVNLGLRTLEFWVDNLNPDFLYPVISRQPDLLTELMTALTDHLRPAPYPYGLLALRLLGKLGGRNRQFLRERTELSCDMVSSTDKNLLKISCRWSCEGMTDVSREEMEADGTRDSSEFMLSLPLDRAVHTLRAIALTEKKAEKTEREMRTEPPEESLTKLSWDEYERLPFLLPENIDLTAYCTDVGETVRKNQAEAALHIVCSSLASVLDLDDLVTIAEIPDSKKEVVRGSNLDDENVQASVISALSDQLRRICDGLLYASAIASIDEKALVMLKGCVTNCFLVVATLQQHIVRKDANGSLIVDEFGVKGGLDQTEKDVSKTSALNLFGFFHLSGPFDGKADPFVVNRSVAECLCSPSALVVDVGLAIISHLLQVSKHLEGFGAGSEKSRCSSIDEKPTVNVERGIDIFLENLLGQLCIMSLSAAWNLRIGIWKGICSLMDGRGNQWCKRFELEIIHIAISGVKTAPREIPSAAINAFRFFRDVCFRMYGMPSLPKTDDSIIYDVLSFKPHDPATKRDDETSSTNPKPTPMLPSHPVLRLFVSEIASTESIVRFTIRYALKTYVIDASPSRKEAENVISAYLDSIRKIVFARSLRLLPLPEQVGAVEALAFIMDQAPNLLPANDHNLLAFLSEFLKMASIADGEMTDKNMVGYVVDKNGFAMPAQHVSNSTTSRTLQTSHSSAVFLRRGCALRSEKVIIFIPEELATGVQLRVSALRLFHSLVKSHADIFFGAEISTPIGNIRPHVISLLFRSLVSEPQQSVLAAFKALSDVLDLSSLPQEGNEGEKPQSRLPKELLQTCIRPVLLNLREYTRLSVALLHGLAHLLSLLSSWFNKSLGQKLLEHLNRWTEPEAIISQGIWKEGEEPAVAAAIIDLFSLLPHASPFVEPLVKVTVKLEAALPLFKPYRVDSPFRKPLARFLNIHCKNAVKFFFHRLKNPHYSELFQSIVKTGESEDLRKLLGGRECSVTLLNACFERPLAIIRSEKSPSGSGHDAAKDSQQSVVEILALHGISTDPNALRGQKEASVHLEVEAKKSKLQLMQKEFSRTNELLQAKLAAHASASTTTSRADVEEANKQNKLAKTALDQARYELSEIQQRYAAEKVQSAGRGPSDNEDAAEAASPKPMSIDALELQFQGFRLIDSLTETDANYLTEHNDILRAFRWLWLSKGRYLRLQHEESIPPRFHGESKALASFLVKYASAPPKDVEVLLFQLLRIFLQPTSQDFTFVRKFLLNVSDLISNEHKRQVMVRFLSILDGEGTEETKVLSIQQVVLPMLYNSLKKEKQGRKGDEKQAVTDRNHESATAILDRDMIRKFTKNILSKDGAAISYGDRLKVELLRLTTLLLEHAKDLVAELHKDFLQFSWSLLKAEDTNCKCWAYVNVCRIIAQFEVQPKIILQVYVALLRSHQQEGKDLTRAALDILIPMLPLKLDSEDFQKFIAYTSKIMYEEGNSAPQLAHIWRMILSHKSIFYPYRHQFIRQMINSLNRLGLPPNCPSENRALAVNLVDLILEWENNSQSLIVSSTVSEAEATLSEASRKRKIDALVATSNEAPKRSKSCESEASRVPEQGSVLDPDLVDTIVNFLLRLKILVADSKFDVQFPHLERRATAQFRAVVRRWKDCSIKPVYFEKIVSMCTDETASNKNVESSIEKRGRDKGKPRASKPSKSSSRSVSTKASTSTGPGSRKSDEVKSVPTSLLSACLDIINILFKETPNNFFFKESSKKILAILGPCFNRVRLRDCSEIRRKLKDFVVEAVCREDGSVLGHDFDSGIRVMLENVILEGVADDSSTSATESSDAFRGFPFDEGKVGGCCVAYFALDVIRKICERMSCSFVESFIGSLVSLLEKLCNKHMDEVTSSHRHGAHYAHQLGASSFYQLNSTPIAGIVEQMCTSTDLPTGNGNSRSTTPKHHLVRIEGLGSALMSLVMSLRLLSSSSLPFKFGRRRRTLFQILSTVLDKSDNPQLLMTSISIVGEWLLKKHGCGPMTLKERTTFLAKISSFDFNGIRDTVSQPLADLVAYFIKRIHTEIDAQYHSVKNLDLLQEQTLKFSETDRKSVDRAIVACLLSANRHVRIHFLRCFGLPDEGKSSDSDNSIHMDHLQQAFRNRSPFELLALLCHCDFEGLGGRLWTVVFVEVLACCCRSGAITSPFVFPWLPAPELINCEDKSHPIDSGFSIFCQRIAEDKFSGKRGSRQSLSAIVELAHGDVFLSENLLTTLVGAAWAYLPNDDMRLSLVPSIECLLGRPYHAQSIMKSGSSAISPSFGDEVYKRIKTNAVRVFLRALMSIRPLPILDTNLLLVLAENYNSWYEVLTLLEQQYDILSAENLSAEGIRQQEAVLSMTRLCFKKLGESRLWMSLAKESCHLPESKCVLSLDVHGMIKDAIEGYTGLVDTVEHGESGTICPSDFEMNLWEERWIDLQKEMCQLNILSEYANGSGDPFLLLDVSWKLQDWDKVRKLCSSSFLVAASELGDPNVKMNEILLAINEGKLTEVENLHAQTAQLGLHRWQLLPEIASGSLAHCELLHFFHRLVELRESGQIMVQVGEHSRKRTFPDLNNLLSAWRHRLPNEYEAISYWENIFLWRTHMFTAITSNFSFADPSTLATLHDKPWTAIRMAKLARKQGIREVALLALNKLTDSPMDLSDAFSKLREQILVYDMSGSDLDRTGGLNLVHTTNLSFFDASQKAELFRLKGKFLASLGGRSKANEAFRHAVQIFSYGKGWTSWGDHCAALGRLAEKQRDHQSAEASKQESVVPSKKVAQYFAQAMGCYIEAVQCDPSDWSRIHIPKCLWMLSKDGSSPGILCQTLESRSNALPSWVWLPWIPQLLSSLFRTEGRTTKAILSGLVKVYPQAIYFPLRAFYLERRDVERSRGSTPSSGNQQGSVSYAENLMSTLRRAHGSLWASLESIVEELIVKFRPSYEEEFLAYITALLEKAEAQRDNVEYSHEHTEDEDAVVASVSKTLSKISDKFFRPASFDSVASRRDERARKTAEFQRKYKNVFETDFRLAVSQLSEKVEGLSPPRAGIGPRIHVAARDGEPVTGTSSPDQDERTQDSSRGSPSRGRVQNESQARLPLSVYLKLLKKWRSLLEAQVALTPKSIPLIESSPSLAMFASKAPDLWAGSCDPRQTTSPSLEHERSRENEASFGQTSTSSSASAASSAAATAALAVAKAAFSEGCGGDYGGTAIEIPGQYAPYSTYDSKPYPELHAKLVRFEATVQVVRRNEQFLRKLGMIGSDGKARYFLLKFAIPYWTRTDERTAQLHYLVDNLLRRGTMSSRNHLSLQPTAVIPIAQRLKMIAVDESRVALDEVYRNPSGDIITDPETITASFYKEVAEQLKEQKFDTLAESEKLGVELSSKLFAFRKVSGSRMLLNYVQERLDGPEMLFQFRKYFAGQLAADSLFQYAFCVVERVPSRFAFLLNTGQVLSPDYRFEYNNQGYLEPRKVPFRMTQNIRTLIGPVLLEGRFIPSMSTIAGAIRERREELDPALRLLMRDDIVSWYMSKSMAKSDAMTQDIEKQLADRVTRNVFDAERRLAECAPTIQKKESDKLSNVEVDVRVRELVDEATRDETLCMLPTSFQAWL